MTINDEEAGSQVSDNTEISVSGRGYVRYIYQTICDVIMSVVAIIIATFLLFCIGWTFWISGPQSLFLLILIVITEIIVFEISDRALSINQQDEEWDEATSHKMLWYGLSYPLMIMLEAAMMVGLAYFIFDESPEWFQIVTNVFFALLLCTVFTMHMCMHCKSIYG